jgi:hypothetical protein
MPGSGVQGRGEEVAHHRRDVVAVTKLGRPLDPSPRAVNGAMVLVTSPILWPPGRRGHSRPGRGAHLERRGAFWVSPVDMTDHVTDRLGRYLGVKQRKIDTSVCVSAAGVRLAQLTTSTATVSAFSANRRGRARNNQRKAQR